MKTDPAARITHLRERIEDCRRWCSAGFGRHNQCGVKLVRDLCRVEDRATLEALERAERMAAVD